MNTITTLSKVSAKELADLNHLMRQLRQHRSRARLATLSELKRIVANKNIVIVIAKNGKRIVGVGSLYIVPKLGRRIAYVEDVVVDSDFRGQGLGEMIVRKLIAVARTKKIQTIGLTSRPERIAGNKLYQKVGFIQKKTNAYRLEL